ncbi:MAG: hypothetical protein MZV64_53230 [Ignavibacteriales bacterium]|nr:hypothetical protein [Ignavibacteriales bacterium]
MKYLKCFYNPASLGRISRQLIFNLHLINGLQIYTYNYVAAGINLEGIGHFCSCSNIYLIQEKWMSELLSNPLGTGERFTVKNLAFGLRLWFDVN